MIINNTNLSFKLLQIVYILNKFIKIKIFYN